MVSLHSLAERPDIAVAEATAELHAGASVSILDIVQAEAPQSQPEPMQHSRDKRPQPVIPDDDHRGDYSLQAYDIGGFSPLSIISGSHSVPPPVMSAAEPISSMVLISPADPPGNFRPGTPEPVENPQVDQPPRVEPRDVPVKLPVQGPVMEYPAPEQPAWLPNGFVKMIRHRRTDGTPWPTLVHNCTCGEQISFDRVSDKMTARLARHTAPGHPPNPDLEGLSVESFAAWKSGRRGRQSRASGAKRVQPSGGQRTPREKPQKKHRRSYKGLGKYLDGSEEGGPPPTQVPVFVYDQARGMITPGTYHHNNPDPQKIQCLCSLCNGAFMSLVRFEAHGGKASSKKWKRSIRLGPFVPPSAEERAESSQPSEFGAPRVEVDLTAEGGEPSQVPSGSQIETSDNSSYASDNSDSDSDDDHEDFMVLSADYAPSASGDTEDPHSDDYAEEEHNRGTAEGDHRHLEELPPGSPDAEGASGGPGIAPGSPGLQEDGGHVLQPGCHSEMVSGDVIGISDSDSDSDTVPISVEARGPVKEELLDDASS